MRCDLKMARQHTKLGGGPSGAWQHREWPFFGLQHQGKVALAALIAVAILAKAQALTLASASRGTVDASFAKANIASQPEPAYFTKSLSYVPQHNMTTHIFGFECQIQFVSGATHPIEPCCGTLAALLLFAGTSLKRCLVLPAHRITAHSGASNCRI